MCTIINVRPTNGILPVFNLATTDGKSMAGNSKASNREECGAATAMSASLGRAGFPLVTVMWKPIKKNTARNRKPTGNRKKSLLLCFHFGVERWWCWLMLVWVREKSEKEERYKHMLLIIWDIFVFNLLHMYRDAGFILHSEVMYCTVR